MSEIDSKVVDRTRVRSATGVARDLLMATETVDVEALVIGCVAFMRERWMSEPERDEAIWMDGLAFWIDVLAVIRADKEDV